MISLNNLTVYQQWCIGQAPWTSPLVVHLSLQLRKKKEEKNHNYIYLLLLAPTRDAAQKMLQICKKFTNQNYIQLRTNEDPKKSKSKTLCCVAARSCTSQASTTPAVWPTSAMGGESQAPGPCPPTGGPAEAGLQRETSAVHR